VSFVVAIDGPGGSGKSTVARRVSELLGWPHLDTGAYYRAAALAVLRAGVDPDDPAAVAAEVGRHEYRQVDGRMLLDGEDVTREIRERHVTGVVSRIAAVPEVRRIMVDLQRRWVAENGGNAVVEGRDIGSVVFPDSPVKVHLTADPSTRAARRAAQMGIGPAEAEAELTARDRIDSTRDVAPLEVAEGAEIVDTTHLGVDQVVSRVLDLVDQRRREISSAARDAPSS
jgi:cytidylate kinase